MEFLTQAFFRLVNEVLSGSKLMVAVRTEQRSNYRPTTVQLLPTFLLLATFGTLTAQTNGVGIGTTNPHPSAILDVTAADQGVLLPRLNDTQEGDISAPLTGLLYFNTTDNVFKYRRNTGYSSLLFRGHDGRIELDLLGSDPAVKSVIDFGANGDAAPDNLNGWKIRLWGQGTLTGGDDYGFGVEPSTLWYASANSHKWYAGNNRVMSLNSTGRLTVPGGSPALSMGYWFDHGPGLDVKAGVISGSAGSVSIMTDGSERALFRTSSIDLFQKVTGRSFFARGGAPGPNNANVRGFAFSGFDGDNDSGLFSEGNGEVSLFTNSQERMEVTDDAVNVKTNLRVDSGYPIEIKNYGNANGTNTGYKLSEWNAIVGGFSTSAGDINEDGSGNIISCYMYKATATGATEPTWHISADFRSHNTHETWSVNVMFIRKEMSFRFDNQ